MRSNASIFALSLLALGGGAPSHAQPVQRQGSVGAQAYGGPQSQPDDLSAETWRAADGTIRTRPARVQPQPQPASEPVAAQPDPQPEPQPQWADPAPAAPQSGTPGASYAVPGSAPVRKTQAAPMPRQEQPRPRQAPPPQVATVMPDGFTDPAAGVTGPSGSSQPAPGETPRYDEIGYAGVRPVSGGGAMDQSVVAVHRSLPANSYVEVTSLDTGRTILVLVTGTDPGADHPIDLSAGAARLLGASGDSIGVRIRTVNPPAMDKAALQAGRPAGDRADAPQVLLTALRKRLPGAPGHAGAVPRAPSVAAPAYSPPRPTAAPRPVPVRPAPAPARPAAGGRYIVQVAALSNASRAQALAQSLGGFVKPGGGLHRVQLGPFATASEAEAARRRAAGAGYGDARVQAN
ncbi:SPOR domain-containing protein [Sphingomonas sp. CBMAI 2297]|uniref:SPOR domain-containing protein n=1 Tax=Sphingomonas sp. CBMAI 2297 TaxID=2991720 RepID=UPI002457D7D3|nr:SPOR domain-containing protein [Sphingomonas sp. CBMAI 2297]MDH4746776.1 SPOR domain-containing protein [Sphingomonas sp. CBMAI 2297]